MKSHLIGIKTVLYCYILAVCISWVSYPILIFLTFLDVNLTITQTIYTVLSTIVLCMLIYILMHEMGTKDRKPLQKEIRYSAKGLVCGAASAIIVILSEILIIYLANKYIMVKHPILEISNVNGYVRLILYMPFYWLFQVLDPSLNVVPKITYLTSIVPAFFMIPASAYGYIMGYKGKKLIDKDLTEIKNKMFYRGEKKK